MTEHTLPRDETPSAYEGATDDVALLRTSRTMAMGTIASRASGFLRTAVIAAVVGTLLFGDAYNVANTIPNILYELLLGGVLTSVVVPLLVRAAAEERAAEEPTDVAHDPGTAYAQRLLTLVVVGLGAVSVLAIVLAPYIVRAYMPRSGPAQLHLATTFARYFFIQIAFYGVGATIAAILNVRSRFAAPMWAPVVNNIVVIATGLLFLAITTGRPIPGHVSDAAVAVLGIGTTLGIVAQTAALLPSLHQAGFRWRWRFDWSSAALREIANVGRWVFVYVLANQVGYYIVVRLATSAARANGHVTGHGYSPYFYAFQLFSLPHAVVTVSVITALLPQMSRHATAGRLDDVRSDMSRGLRLSSAVLVPATAALLVLGTEVAVVVFNHHNISLAEATYIGDVLIAFAVGLLPFSFFQLMLRAYYALGDTRTPALVNVAVNGVNIVVDVALYLTLPDQWRVVGLAVGYSASYAVGLLVMVSPLRRRLAGLDGYNVVRTLARLGVAAVLGAIPAAVVAAGARALLGAGQAAAWVGLVGGCAVGGAVFVWAARRMRVEELTAVAGAVGLRFRRA